MVYTLESFDFIRGDWNSVLEGCSSNNEMTRDDALKIVAELESEFPELVDPSRTSYGMSFVVFGRWSKCKGFLAGYEQGVRESAKVAKDAVVTTSFPDGTTEHKEISRDGVAKLILALLEKK